MKNYILFLLTFFISYISFGQKQVAITIDDLISNGPHKVLEHIEAFNDKIIQTAQSCGITAVGFVNEEKLNRDGERDRRVQILKNWLDAGMDLGNHTYSHPSLYKTPLWKFKEEVIKGEIITKGLLEERGLKMRYFRHSYLNTGPDSLTKASFEQFLKDHKYTVAPVTVESSDYVFNKIYTNAYLNGDTSEMRLIGRQYVEHTLNMFEWMESATDQVVGREIPHIFLCHVNPLNADYLGEIYQRLEEAGYTFISLETALQDPVYQKTDYHIGAWGLSWVYRWDKGKAKEWLQTEPELSPEILDKYRQ
ncbi:MAG: polysaccharide deacetylase family protein [Marinoscillum sp.]